MTVPPGLRQPPFERGNFETIEVQVPAAQVVPVPPAEPADPREQQRHDIALIGPIAALVLALTICTLILEHPAARVVAAVLATLGLITAVVLMLMGKRPQPGRHVARHAVDRDESDQDGTVRIPTNWSTTDPRR